MVLLGETGKEKLLVWASRHWRRPWRAPRLTRSALYWWYLWGQILSGMVTMMKMQRISSLAETASEHPKVQVHLSPRFNGVQTYDPKQNSALQRAQGYQGCRHQEVLEVLILHPCPYTFLDPCGIFLGPGCASGAKVKDKMALPVRVPLGLSSSAIALRCVSLRAWPTEPSATVTWNPKQKRRVLAAEKKKKPDEQRLIETELAEEAQEDSMLKWACLSPEQYDE